MIACYPIGVPLAFTILLYTNRAALDPPVDGRPARESDNDADERIDRAIALRQADVSVRHLELLYGPYEPAYFYWEVVETIRRLAATSALLLVPSTVVRVILAICLSLGTLKLYGYFAPFIDRSDDILAETLQWVTCLLMLSMLLTMLEVDGVMQVMIALQLSAVAIVVILVGSDLQRERKAIAKLAVKARKEAAGLRRSMSDLKGVLSPSMRSPAKHADAKKRPRKKSDREHGLELADVRPKTDDHEI